MPKTNHKLNRRTMNTARITCIPVAARGAELPRRLAPYAGLAFGAQSSRLARVLVALGTPGSAPARRNLRRLVLERWRTLPGCYPTTMDDARFIRAPVPPEAVHLLHHVQIPLCF